MNKIPIHPASSPVPAGACSPGMITGGFLDDVVKVTAHRADVRDFDGYNEVYRKYFSKPYLVRTTVQSVVPGGSLVEIDVIALRPERKGL